jgi:tetratricopeptide (TPR) repeat protein
LRNLFLILGILVLKIQVNAQNESDNSWVMKQYQLLNYQSVIDSLEKKAGNTDLNFDEYKYLGLSYQNMFNFNKALNNFSNARKLVEYNTQITYLAGKAAKQANDNELAEGLFTEITEKDSTFKLAKIELANIAMEKKKYRFAIELFDELLKTDSTNIYFLTRIALANVRTGSYEDAVKYYNKALNINPFDANASLQLSKYYFESEQFEKAKSILEEGITGNSGNLLLNKMLAETLFKLKQYEAAVVYYTKSLALGDSTAGLFQRLGFSYYFIATSDTKKDSEIFVQKMNESLDALNKASEIDPDNPLTSLYLGICHKELGNLNEAKSYFEETLNLIYPDYISDVYTNLGATNELMNNLPDAISAYQEAYSYDPSNKVLLFYLASAMDRYYADRRTPALYYKKFLREDTTENTILIEYAQERIEKLAEQVHFNGN